MGEMNYSIAEALVRIFVGILFVSQGCEKLFAVRISNVITAYKNEAEGKRIPAFLIILISWYTSLVEFVGGFLLIIGLFSTIASYLLAVDLLLVAIAFSCIKPLWDMQHVFPRLILLTIVILLSNHFCFGLDTLLFR